MVQITHSSERITPSGRIRKRPYSTLPGCYEYRAEAMSNTRNSLKRRGPPSKTERMRILGTFRYAMSVGILGKGMPWTRVPVCDAKKGKFTALKKSYHAVDVITGTEKDEALVYSCFVFFLPNSAAVNAGLIQCFFYGMGNVLRFGCFFGKEVFHPLVFGRFPVLG